MSTYPDYVHQTLARAKEERVAPYRPSIDARLANLFSISGLEENHSSTVVDWSFLDADDGQPGEPADWVKKNIKRLERWGENDELHQEMIADPKNRHRWTRNIDPPLTPKRYDPNNAPFIPPAELFDDVDDVDEDDL